MKIRTKVVLGLISLALLSSVPILIAFEMQKDKFQKDAFSRLETAAYSLSDLIDRNLFERYGDVQAFAQNRVAYNPANWRNPSEGNPLIMALNSYMANYGLYKLSMLVDLQGNVLAVNTRTAAGKALQTADLYKMNFAKAEWFTSALNGSFLQGRNGLTGTAVSQPSGEPFIQQLYDDKGYTISFSARVTNDDGEMIGIWVNFASFDFINNLIAGYAKEFLGTQFKSAQMTLVDNTGKILTDYDHTNPTQIIDHEALGKINLYTSGVQSVVAAIENKNTGSIIARNSRTGKMQANGYSYSAGAGDYPGLGWTALVRVDPKELFVSFYDAQNSMLLVVFFVFVISLIASLWVGRAFAQPIRSMTDTMRLLANGDTAIEIPSTQRSDEVGDMARAVVVFKENMIQTEQLRAEQEQQKAMAEQQKRKAMHTLADSFESNVKTVVTGVSASASQMRGNAERLSQLAGETKSISAVVSSSAIEAAQTATQVASAAEELTAAIGEISAQVQKSSSVASQASTQAESINQSMHLLVEKSNRVGEVIQFITNIASQINLLALNATIESARAGEAGRGFAVVASEVKNLANQTAKATEEIIQQVQSMQEATHDAVDSVGQIISIISEISANTAGVAAAVEEQSAATNEISRTIANTAESTNAISQSIVSVEKGADETGNSSRQVLDSAKMLSEQALALSARVDEFLSNVRNS